MGQVVHTQDKRNVMCAKITVVIFHGNLPAYIG
jgi:hypothetical protein